VVSLGRAVDDTALLEPDPQVWARVQQELGLSSAGSRVPLSVVPGQAPEPGAVPLPVGAGTPTGVTQDPFWAVIAAATGSSAGVPEVVARGQGGLLDVVLDSAFERNRELYFCFSEPGAGGNSTALARAKLSDDMSRLENVRIIFSGKPKVESSHHFGCRIVETPDGHLFLTLGDRYSRMRDAQTLDTHHGKVVRVQKDGVRERFVHHAQIHRFVDNLLPLRVRRPARHRERVNRHGQARGLAATKGFVNPFPPVRMGHPLRPGQNVVGERAIHAPSRDERGDPTARIGKGG
jgi:hypothetical protein